MSHFCGNKSKDDSYIKKYCCQVLLVQEARWKGICESEDRVRKSKGTYFHQRFTRSNICKDLEVAMRLVSLQMRGSVARNYTFNIIWRCYGPRQDILEYWGTIIYCLLSYHILFEDEVL